MPTAVVDFFDCASDNIDNHMKQWTQVLEIKFKTFNL